MERIIDLKETIKKYVSKIEEYYPYASAFSSEINGLRIMSGTHEENIIFKTPETGVTFTAFTGDHFLEYSVDKLNEKSFDNALKYFLKNRNLVIKNTNINIDPGEKIEKDFEHNVMIDPLKISIQEKLNKARENKEVIENKNKNIVAVYSILDETHTNELFINRNKTLYQKLHRFDLMYMIIFSNGEKTVNTFGGHSKSGGFEHSNLDLNKLERYIKNGVKFLNAPRLKPGTYKAIFSPAMSGMFAHEAFGHGTETDMFLKKRSKGEEYLGKQVASPLVNMFDSPALEGAAASFFFDNEGCLSKLTQIIKDGILVSGLTDLYSATKLKFKRTPNGRRESYSHKAYARMTNTYFEKGNSNLDNMLKEIEYGFLVDFPTNGMEDPKGWGIQLEALLAREIKDGKLTENIFSPVIVTGYVPDLLKSIDAVSNDFEIDGLGFCGKGYKEWVKVTDGGPYLRLTARLA